MNSNASRHKEAKKKAKAQTQASPEQNYNLENSSVVGASAVNKPVFSLGSGAQAKVTVGKAGDQYEREADEVADKVSHREPVGKISRIPAGGLKAQTEHVQRDAEETQKKKITQSGSEDTQEKCSGCEEGDKAQTQADSPDSGEAQEIRAQHALAQKNSETKGTGEGEGVRQTKDDEAQEKGAPCESEDIHPRAERHVTASGAGHEPPKRNTEGDGGAQTFAVQGKVAIGSAGGPHEREAESVSERVSRGGDAGSITSIAQTSRVQFDEQSIVQKDDELQEKCATCDKEESQTASAEEQHSQFKGADAPHAHNESTEEAAQAQENARQEKYSGSDEAQTAQGRGEEKRQANPGSDTAIAQSSQSDEGEAQEQAVQLNEEAQEGDDDIEEGPIGGEDDPDGPDCGENGTEQNEGNEEGQESETEGSEAGSPEADGDTPEADEDSGGNNQEGTENESCDDESGGEQEQAPSGGSSEDARAEQSCAGSGETEAPAEAGAGGGEGEGEATEEAAPPPLVPEPAPPCSDEVAEPEDTSTELEGSGASDPTGAAEEVDGECAQTRVLVQKESDQSDASAQEQFVQRDEQHAEDAKTPLTPKEESAQEKIAQREASSEQEKFAQKKAGGTEGFTQVASDDDDSNAAQMEGEASDSNCSNSEAEAAAQAKDQAQNKAQVKARDNKENNRQQQKGSIAASAIKNRDSGVVLNPDVRNQLEPYMHVDLSSVRVHTGPNAQIANKGLGARAFTHKEHVWLGAGQSQNDIKLMAHELTHSVQQGALSQNLKNEQTNTASAEENDTEKSLHNASAAQSKEKNEAHADRNPSERSTLGEEGFAESIAQSQLKGESPDVDPGEAQAQSEGENRQLIQSEAGFGPTSTSPVPSPTPVPANVNNIGGSDTRATPASSAGVPGKLTELAVLPVTGKAPTAAETNQDAVKERDGKPSVKGEKAQARKSRIPEAMPEEKQVPSDINGIGRFTNVIGKLHALAKQQMGSAASKSTSKKATGLAINNASKAVKVPKGEALAFGKSDQLGTMKAAEKTENKFTEEDIKNFVNLVKARVAEISPPTNPFEMAIFKFTNQADQFKQGVVENVNNKTTTVKSQLYTTAITRPKEVDVPTPEPFNYQSAPPTPLDIGSQGVLPPPKADHEISLEKENSGFHTKNKADGITREKLVKANDPRFTAAQDAIDSYDENTREAPGKYQTLERKALGAGKKTLLSDEKRNAGAMVGDRLQGNADVEKGQKGQIKKEFFKRSSVKTRLEKIYSETHNKVVPRLDGLEDRVKETFDVKEKKNLAEFNVSINKEVNRFKKARYSGLGGFFTKVWDKTLGDVNSHSKVKKIYKTATANYVNGLDQVIKDLAKLVVDTLRDCHTEIDKGIAAVQKEIKGLKNTKDTAAKEAAADILDRFKDMRSQVNDKKESMVDLLANKYKDSRQKMNKALEKVKEENRSFRQKAARFIDKVKKAYREFRKRLSKILARARSTISDILDDPIEFLKNLLTAVKRGFNQFKEKIVFYMKKALFEWMFGSFGRAGVDIQVPKVFTAKTIFGFILSVMGFNRDWLLEQAAKAVGRGKVEKVQKMYGYIKPVLTNGPGGMFNLLKKQAGELKNTIVNEIQTWVTMQIIKAAIVKLVSMFNPAGAIVQAVLTIVDVVMFFANNIDLILKVLETIVDSVHKVVKGNVQGAANMIERALGMGLTLAIRFLARFARISGVVEKISGIIKRFKGRIERAIVRALGNVAKKLGGFIKKGKKSVKKTTGKAAAGILRWWRKKYAYRVAGKTHTVAIKGREQSAKVVVRRSPGIPLSQYISAFQNAKKKDRSDAVLLAQKIEAKPGRGADKQRDAQKKVKLFNKLAPILIRIANSDAMAPPSVITYGRVRGDGGGTGMKASILSNKQTQGGLVADDPPISVNLRGNGNGNANYTSNPPYYIQGHLLNAELGGPGKRQNLTPITSSANSKHFSTVEKHVKKWVNTDKKVAYYDVSVEYPGPLSTEKEPIKALACSLVCTVYPMVYDSGRSKWKKNLGGKITGMSSNRVEIMNTRPSSVR